MRVTSYYLSDEKGRTHWAGRDAKNLFCGRRTVRGRGGGVLWNSRTDPSPWRLPCGGKRFSGLRMTPGGRALTDSRMPGEAGRSAICPRVGRWKKGFFRRVMGCRPGALPGMFRLRGNASLPCEMPGRDQGVRGRQPLSAENFFPFCRMICKHHELSRMITNHHVPRSPLLIVHFARPPGPEEVQPWTIITWKRITAAMTRTGGC